MNQGKIDKFLHLCFNIRIHFLLMSIRNLHILIFYNLRLLNYPGGADKWSIMMFTDWWKANDYQPIFIHDLVVFFLFFLLFNNLWFYRLSVILCMVLWHLKKYLIYQRFVFLPIISRLYRAFFLNNDLCDLTYLSTNGCLNWPLILIVINIITCLINDCNLIGGIFLWLWFKCSIDYLYFLVFYWIVITSNFCLLLIFCKNQFKDLHWTR